MRLVFKNGKIVEATSTNTRKLNEVLDADEGARYVGEFAIGFNPHCTRPMKDILFDEKIAGSIHFTPGGSYDEASNGNKSANGNHNANGNKNANGNANRNANH